LAHDLDSIRSDYEGKEINIVAHSYGTKMLFDLFRYGSHHRFDNIFLIGSIIKPEPVREMYHCYNRLHCDAVTYDFVSHALEILMFGTKYKSTSVTGIQSPKSAVGRWSGGHSNLTSESHFFGSIASRLKDKSCLAECLPPNWFFGQHSVTIYQVIWAGVLLAVLIFLAS
jgi:hypothetical protein